MSERAFHMTPDEFRSYGAEVVEWIARYMERVDDLPVRARVEPGDVRAMLPPSPPQHGEPFDAMLADVDRIIMPGITHWESPKFFGFFPANNSGPSILGEMLSAGLGVQGMLWVTSPACTELETHMMDWLVEMLGLPQRFRSDGTGGGVIQDTASSATLCALLAARERATAGASNREGARARLAVYTSTQAHSSVEKAVRIAGIGSDNLRAIATDEDLAMRPDELARAIDADVAAGITPAAVVATVGTTSTMAVDPVRAIGETCARAGAWLHVDAAMAGTAGVCPEFRAMFDGLELADSYCFNPHKWMFTNFDCDAFWVADRAALTSALSILPEYLRNAASGSGAVIDYRDWQVPLGRRFRALKLWFVIRHYGVEGLQHHVRRHVGLAEGFEAWVRADERFVLPFPRTLNLVCFAHRDGDDATRALLDELEREDLFVTHTVVDGRVLVRVSIGGVNTEARHVERAWDAIRRAADRVT